MEQELTPSVMKPARVPWNKGKLVGAKPPLRPSHVWSIRTKLQIEGKMRDLALFNLAIDSRKRSKTGTSCSTKTVDRRPKASRTGTACGTCAKKTSPN